MTCLSPCTITIAELPHDPKGRVFFAGSPCRLSSGRRPLAPTTPETARGVNVGMNLLTYEVAGGKGAATENTGIWGGTSPTPAGRRSPGASPTHAASRICGDMISPSDRSKSIPFVLGKVEVTPSRSSKSDLNHRATEEIPTNVFSCSLTLWFNYRLRRLPPAASAATDAASPPGHVANRSGPALHRSTDDHAIACRSSRHGQQLIHRLPQRLRRHILMRA